MITANDAMTAIDELDAIRERQERDFRTLYGAVMLRAKQRFVWIAAAAFAEGKRTGYDNDEAVKASCIAILPEAAKYMPYIKRGDDASASGMLDTITHHAALWCIEVFSDYDMGYDKFRKICDRLLVKLD